MPNHVPADNGKAFVGDLTKNEEVANGTGPLNHLSSTNEWPGRKTKSHTSFTIEGLLLTIHGSLG